MTAPSHSSNGALYLSCPDSYNPVSASAAIPLSGAAQRFKVAIEQSRRRSADSSTELRDAACAYVAELKAQALPPERVLVQIKRLLGMSAGRLADDEAERQLLARVISWCIEAYYKDG